MQRTIRYLVCVEMLAAGAQMALAQGITIDTTDIKERFVIGKTITNWNDSITTTADIGAPGESSWDFSGLKKSGDPVLMKIVARTTSPYISQFPAATHVMEVPLKITFLYEGVGNVTLTGIGHDHLALGSDLVDFGLAGSGTASLLGASFPASGQWLNSPSAIFYGLPMRLGKTWTTNFTETLSGVANTPFGNFSIGPNVTAHAITYTADAYGPLTLPGARVQEALRIRKLDRFVSSTTNGLRVGYIFVAKNGAAVQMTANDTSATSGTVSVSFVQWTEGEWDDIVPIELASFTATQWDGKSVNLQWTTLSETNNFGFYIQRRGPDDREFTELPGSFVAGHGTTGVPQKYSYLDIPRSADAWWYRLKQVDLDGAAHLSEPTQVRAVTSVQEIIPTSYELAQNYPNPFNPSTTIRYGLPNRSHVALTVFNTLGQQVAVLQNGEQDAGYHEVQFGGSGLASGVYLYRIQAGGFVETRKLVVLR